LILNGRIRKALDVHIQSQTREYSRDLALSDERREFNTQLLGVRLMAQKRGSDDAIEAIALRARDE